MNLVTLTAQDLASGALLVLMLAALSWRLRLGMEGRLIVAALRTTVQLLLIGLVLKLLFESLNLLFMAAVAALMLLAAGREVMSRQQHRLRGAWGYGIGTLSMLLSSFTVTLLALTAIIQVDPWYTPQYAIPLLGMMLGNCMTGIALAVDRLTHTARQQRGSIEARLLVGMNWAEAIAELRRESIRVGLIPTINAMAAAGIISLPGTMTGQILSGTPPLEAVKYQILIMFMIAASTGIGSLVAVLMASRRLFDERQRLRLDRLRS
jgi:putative ABC transport system permease protein